MSRIARLSTRALRAPRRARRCCARPAARPSRCPWPARRSHSADPQFQGNIYVARNITERKRAERRIRYLARYDTLTKMPNRMQFQHLLQQAIARSRRNQRSLALLYLDLDRFKEVNDTFGHAAGDRTLEILSERLTRELEQGDRDRPARGRRVRDVHRRSAARRRQSPEPRRPGAHPARRDQPRFLREPAGGLSHGQRRHRDLSPTMPRT